MPYSDNKNAKIYLGIIVIITALAGFYGWERWGDQYMAKWRAESNYKMVMKADTFGGKTPEETLNLFISALKSGDAELASKYFMLDENLSREKWLKTMLIFKEKGLLNNMADDVKLSSTEMELNEYSGAWKIKDFK